MKFFIPGLIIGAVINIFVLSPVTGIAFFPEFTSPLGSIDSLAPSPFLKAGDSPVFTVKMPDKLYLIKRNGIPAAEVPQKGLYGTSGNGDYHIRYEKVGSEIEFFNSRGERFWKQKSRESPYLSYSGHLIFMLNGDQSSARILDHNGNEIGVKRVSGRICTVISFSEAEDFGGIGFLDGSFHVIDWEGEDILHGTAYNSGVVKGIAVSSNGRYAVVHSGDAAQDHIQLFNIAEGESYIKHLPDVHYTKTAISVSAEGRVMMLDRKDLLCLDNRAKSLFTIPIEEKKNGQASVKEGRSAYSVCYTTKKGLSKFMVVSRSGRIIYSRNFPGESFLDATVSGDVIFLRGSDNLYCYSLQTLSD